MVFSKGVLDLALISLSRIRPQVSARMFYLQEPAFHLLNINTCTGGTEVGYKKWAFYLSLG